MDLCLEYLTVCYESQNCYDEAVATLKDLLDLRKKTTKVESSEIAWCLYHLGVVADRQTHYGDAQPYLKQASAIYAKFPKDPNAASCLEEYNYMKKMLSTLNAR